MNKLISFLKLVSSSFYALYNARIERELKEVENDIDEEMFMLKNCTDARELDKISKNLCSHISKYARLKKRFKPLV